MKWDRIYENLSEVPFSRRCAFCLDQGWDHECQRCRINKTICDEEGEKGFFLEINDTKDILLGLVSKMGIKLRVEYNKPDKVKK